MSEKGILDWFSKRTENTVRVKSRSHGIIVLDAVSELNFALKSMAGGKEDAAVKGLERLFLSEHEADRIEDKLCVDISGGELSVQEREDLIRFVRKMDEIANWSKEAALYVQLILETHAKVPQEIWESTEKMSEEIMTAVKYLIKVVEALNGDPKDVLKNVDGVNDQERIVDTLYFQATKQAHLSNMDPKAVMLVCDMIRALEMSADSCKSCADTITILVTSRSL